MRPGTALRSRVVGPTLAELAGAGGVLLDVGGYDGSVAASVPRAGGLVIVVDVDRPGLAKARRQGVAAVAASGTALPFASGSVGLALSLDVLTCLEPAEAEQVYPEIGRVLRPGGRLLATEVDERYSLPFVDTGAAFARWNVHTAGFTSGRLAELLKGGRLRVVEHRMFYGLLTRLSYSVLFFLARPLRGARLKRRAWELAGRIERRWCVSPQAHFVVAVKEP